jgi:hypothetical protein
MTEILKKYLIIQITIILAEIIASIIGLKYLNIGAIGNAVIIPILTIFAAYYSFKIFGLVGKKLEYYYYYVSILVANLLLAFLIPWLVAWYIL